MKIFYFGSVIDNTSFDENVEKSKIKPSASAQSFEIQSVAYQTQQSRTRRYVWRQAQDER